MKKALANASAFFNEINPFRDLWNALRAWNTPAACEIAAAVRIYFISLDAKHQISQFAEQIISPWVKRAISLFLRFKTLNIGRGAFQVVQKHRPSRQARPSPSAPAMKKALANASAFFNEINPFRDLWNALRAWNTPTACEIAAAVRIYFISLDAKHQISQFTKWIISHRSAARYFTFYKFQS